MSDFILSCTNQRKQRSRFFYHEAGDPSSRFNIISPYTYNSNNQLLHSSNDFNMRRKAEILKYDANNNKKANKKEKYAFLATKTKKNKTCSDDNSSKPTSSSGVPGKIIQLYQDNDVPLYNYKDVSRQFQFQNIPFDNFKRIFDKFPFYNIFAENGEYVNIMDIIILNPNNNQFRFNFSIPISIQFEADFAAINDVNADITTVQIALFSSLLDIYYSDSLISSNNIEFRSTPELDSDIVNSTLSVSLDFMNSSPGKIKFSQYVGNIILNNVTLQTITQYVYTILLKCNINYAEYTGEVAETENDTIDPYRVNIDGGNVTNDNSRNVTNVKYNFFTNFDNNDPAVFNSYENVTLALFDGTGEIVDDSNRTFSPFNLTANPV